MIPHWEAPARPSSPPPLEPIHRPVAGQLLILEAADGRVWWSPDGAELVAIGTFQDIRRLVAEIDDMRENG